MYTIKQAPKDLTPPWEGLQNVVTEMRVHIPKVCGDKKDCPTCLGTRFIFKPNNDGPFPCPDCNKEGSVTVIHVPVWAWEDTKTGEVYLNGNTTDYLDSIKKKEMEMLGQNGKK